LSSKLVRYVRWFSVGVVLGLAPFLGILPIPGFSALLEMYPYFMRGWLIPLASLLMGVVAILIEVLGTKIPRPAVVRRGFWRTLAVWSAAFLTLLYLYPRWVARVEIDGGQRSAALVTGSTVVPPLPPGSKCQCTPGEPAKACISVLLEEHIEACFGSERVAFATQVLALLYLVLTGSFVLIVGFLILLQQSMADQAAKRAEKKKGSSRPPAAS